MADPQELFNEAKCYLCEGVSVPQALRLELIARAVVAADPAADVTALGLLDYAKCYECYGASISQLLELALPT